MPALRTGATEERLQLAAEVRRLRDEERLVHTEIAARLKISRSYVSELLSDPDGSATRARKDRYRHPCPNCGEPMDGSSGPNHPPSSCAACAAAANSDTRFWTPDTIIEAFRAFHEALGRNPNAADLSGLAPSQSGGYSAARLEEIVRWRTMGLILPAPSTVRREFGSWPNALKAAGLDPSPLGGPSHRGSNRDRVGSREAWIIEQLQDGPLSRGELCQRAGVDITGALYSLRRTRRVRSKRSGIRASRGGSVAIYSLPTADREEEEMAQQWIVLTTHNGKIEEVGISEAPTKDLAVERIAPGPGAYHVIELSRWKPVTVANVTKLAVVED